MSENREDRAFEKTVEVECAVCFSAHDEEIHEATLSIHRWFQHQVTHVLEEDSLYLPRIAANAAAS